MKKKLLQNKTVVVTGGASGIGRAIAIECANEGADVLIADVIEKSRSGEIPTQDYINNNFNVDARFQYCDVSIPGDLKSAVVSARKLGGIDVMVNNAGLFRLEDFFSVEEDDYDSLMDINVKGTYFGSQAAAKEMVETNRSGSIINISSTAGLYGVGEYVSYCASKGAIKLITYSLSDLLGPFQIRVNAIHPGVIISEMTQNDSQVLGTERESKFESSIPLNRFGNTEDVASAAVYLASDSASYVNGESLIVDGGLTNTG